MKLSTGINGFGRFGLHLLKYWLDRSRDAHFAISHINDDVLTIQQAFAIISSDRRVAFDKYKVGMAGDTITFAEPDGTQHAITYTNKPKAEIPWLGGPQVIFECSGKSTSAKDCETYLSGQTRLVIISATSWDADKTLIYGFNHEQYAPESRIISYGSCTVNAFVPIANYLHKKYGVSESDANFVHNIQEHRLPGFNTLKRKFCTLEKSGPLLLPFLDNNNFAVNYTVVPYAGVSTIDLRFKLKKPATRDEILADLGHAFSSGELQGLYAMDDVDIGPEAYNCTMHSAVFIAEGLRVLGDNVYLFGYFDNENSANRFFDLAEYMCTRGWY